MSTTADDLVFSEMDALKKELSVVPPEAVKADETADSGLAAQANSVVDRILSVESGNHEAQAEAKAAVESMGLSVQKEASRRSAMLKQPLHTLAERSEDGGEVAKSLLNLRDRVEELDPAKFDLEPGFFGRLLAMIPGIGTPMRRYFSRYQSAEPVIDDVMRSLNSGKEQLKRDNVTLLEDQKAMRALGDKLEKSIKLGQLIDKRLEDRLATEIPAEDPKTKFIQEELLFPLRQRIQDLQQQLLVTQQAYLTSEMIVRNNKELMRGVDRASNVTVNALQTAVTLAMALANQRIVLEKVQAVTETTNSLLASTAERLRTQGAEIQKQASGTQLDMEMLKKAFGDVRAAFDDISTYRQKALPQMAQNILEMDKLAEEAEQTIRDTEQGNEVSKGFFIEVED